MISGPLGTRLTPRGSFDAYIETVRGTADEWTAADLAVSDRLRESLGAVAMRKAVQLARLREMVIGTVGHDLRRPQSRDSSATDGTTFCVDISRSVIECLLLDRSSTRNPWLQRARTSFSKEGQWPQSRIPNSTWLPMCAVV